MPKMTNNVETEVWSFIEDIQMRKTGISEEDWSSICSPEMCVPQVNVINSSKLKFEFTLIESVIPKTYVVCVVIVTKISLQRLANRQTLRIDAYSPMQFNKWRLFGLFCVVLVFTRKWSLHKINLWLQLSRKLRYLRFISFFFPRFDYPTIIIFWWYKLPNRQLHNIKDSQSSVTRRQVFQWWVAQFLYMHRLAEYE